MSKKHFNQNEREQLALNPHVLPGERKIDYLLDEASGAVRGSLETKWRLIEEASRRVSVH